MHLILFILIQTVAAAFQGLVGFGQGLIAAPLSLVFVDKNTVLTALMVSGLVLNLSLAVQNKEPLDSRLLTPLLLGSLLGLPLGVAILVLLPLGTLKIFIGTLSIVLTVAILFSKFKIRHLYRAAPVAGFLAGLLQTSAGIPGPPVVLFLTGSGVPKNSARKILVIFFLWLNILGVPLYWAGHIFTTQGMLFGLVTIPVVLVGGRLGHRFAEFVPHAWYTNIALVTVGVSGALAIYSGLH